MEERKKLAKDNALPTSVLMEVSKTYTDIAEKITGEKIPISDDPKAEIIKILDEKYGLIEHKGVKRKAEGGISWMTMVVNKLDRQYMRNNNIQQIASSQEAWSMLVPQLHDLGLRLEVESAH